MNFQYPNNHQNCFPRPPKVTKMASKQVPKITKFMNKSKKWNLMKTLIFTILLKGWDIRIHQNFHSKINKIRNCNPNVILDCSNQRKSEKVLQKGLQWETQNPSKITENPFWSRLSAPLHPMITKILKKWCPQTQNAWKLVPQDLKKSIKLWNKLMKSAWTDACNCWSFQWFHSCKSFESI